MAKMEKSILLDKVLTPVYYEHFSCTASFCRDSCCREPWRIEFNKKDYLKIRHAKKLPELESHVANCIRRLRGEEASDGMYAAINMNSGFCPLLNDTGLCSLQLACGEEMLSTICRSFPRIENTTPAALERSLSPACEAVLQHLWDSPDGVDFMEEPLPNAEQKTYLFYSDTPLRWVFPTIRSYCIDILQDRRYPLSRRMLLLGFALRYLCDRGGTDIDLWQTQISELLDNPDTAITLEGLRGNRVQYIVNNLKVLLSLELPQNSPFTSVRNEILNTLAVERRTLEGQDAGMFQSNHYEMALAHFYKSFPTWEIFFENLMVTVFFCLQLPRLDSMYELWKSFVNLCTLYSFYTFCAVLGCIHDGSRERLFHILVQVSRRLLHSSERQAQLRDELFQNDCATLAHMAILVSG